MVWGSIIGAVAGLAGGILQNRAGRSAAGRQMSFQEQMASTRYQRTMADMRAAGLNPMLAYAQGGGPVPGGASYSPVNVGAAGVTGAVAGQSSALQTRRNAAELGVLRQSENTGYATMQKTQAEQALVNENLKIARENVWSAKAEGQRAKATIRFYQTATGQRLRHAQLTGESLGLPGAVGLLARGAGAFAGDAEARSKKPRIRKKSRFKPRIPKSRPPNWARSQIGPPRSKR